MLQTEHEFQLPMGYLDADGNLHREGVMRLATAADEILPLRDPRVRRNEAYLTVVLLSRVITRLGALDDVDVRVIEGLYAADLGYLQDLYNKINSLDEHGSALTCPACNSEIHADDADTSLVGGASSPGGSWATRSTASSKR